MPIIATKGADIPEREPVPAGTHVARCYQIVEIGHVPEEYQGETKIAHKVRVTWELPDELREFKEGEGQKPMSISKEYTLSTNERATLRHHLDAWRGKPMTDTEAMAFDIEAILGVPCLLNVIRKKSADGKREYANIAGISPLVKGMVCPPQVNPSRVLSFDKFDQDLFLSLPEFIREKIGQSEEYAVLTGRPIVDEEDPAPKERKQEKIDYTGQGEINIDDIPF